MITFSVKLLQDDNNIELLVFAYDSGIELNHILAPARNLCLLRSKLSYEVRSLIGSSFSMSTWCVFPDAGLVHHPVKLAYGPVVLLFTAWSYLLRSYYMQVHCQVGWLFCSSLIHAGN